MAPQTLPVMQIESSCANLTRTIRIVQHNTQLSIIIICKQLLIDDVLLKRQIIVANLR